jgi:hypothetical protein
MEGGHCLQKGTCEDEISREHPHAHQALDIRDRDDQSAFRIAPIQSIPSELLTEIFEVVRADPLYQFSKLPFQVVASHVSHHWREVATRYPSFWTDLVILPQHPPERAAVYLERSQRLPLDITFDYRTLPDIPRIQDVPLPVLDMVIHHSSRWRQFIFMTLLGSVDTGRVMAGLTDLVAPQLECLRLIFKHDTPHTEHTLYAQLTPSVWPPFSSLFTTLTTLELCSLNVYSKPTLTEFRCLVSASPSLINLTIHGSVIELRTSTEPVIEIPSLISLSIGLFPKLHQYLFRLLNLLSMPGLESLEFYTLTSQEWASFRKYLYADVEHFPRYPVLHSLILIDVDVRNYVYPAWHEDRHTQTNTTGWLMRGLPTLRHLSLVEVDAHKVLADLLLRQGENPDVPPLWPDLHTITLPHRVTLNFLRRVVSSRSALGLPLVTLRLEPPFLAGLTPEDSAWLEARVRLERFHRTLYTELWNTSDPWLPRHVIPSMDQLVIDTDLGMDLSSLQPVDELDGPLGVPTADEYARQYAPEVDFSSYLVSWETL